VTVEKVKFELALVDVCNKKNLTPVWKGLFIIHNGKKVVPSFI
jgi:hypothetical protein